MLPKSFNAVGVLSQDYEATFDEIRQSLLVLGPESPRPDWDVVWRRTLVDNLEIMVRQLWAMGITKVWMNGSFVQNRSHPGDIDGCFECDFDEWNSGELARRLNENAPKKIWGWKEEDMKLVLGTYRFPMWPAYRVELFPACPGRPVGLRNDANEFLTFPEAYRFTKDGLYRKGIVLLKADNGGRQS